MEFLKPYQGPGRSNNGIVLTKDEEETECDLGFQVLAKATSNSTDDDVKQISLANSNPNLFATSLASVLPNFVGGGGLMTSSALGLPTTSSAVTNGFAGASGGPLLLPVPSLPTVQLPPSLTAKPILSGMGNSSTSTSSSTASSMGVSIASLSAPSSSLAFSTSNGNTATHMSASMSATALTTPSSMASQLFALPQLSAKGSIPMPSSSTASSVGCLIIEPQLFASADTFKKELTNVPGSLSSTSTSTTQITPSNLHIYPNISAQVTPSSSSSSSSAANTTNTNRLNPPLITKIRRVQPSPHQTNTAINLSFSSAPAPVTSTSPALSTLGLNAAALNGFLNTIPPNLLPNFSTNFAQSNLGSTTTITTPSNSSAVGGGGGIGGPSPAKRLKTAELEISAILQANRDLDANTLFFLSLARSVRNMPTKFQSLAKMRCMRIVSDIELELDNVSCENGDGNPNPNNTKYCTNNTDSPPPAIGSNINEPPHSEHFVYVMSPSRVEGMIDLSSDDENTTSVNGAGSGGGGGGVTITGGGGGVGVGATPTAGNCVMGSNN
ncbi:uncharacterized protein isoform X2 [Musca autumnalis]